MEIMQITISIVIPKQKNEKDMLIKSLHYKRHNRSIVKSGEKFNKKNLYTKQLSFL